MTRLRHLVSEYSRRIESGFDRQSRCLVKGFLLPILSLLVLLCPSLAGVASAGVNTWTTNGPGGGAAHALAIDPSSPSIVYAGTGFGGVFKSTNGGASWSPVNTGLPPSGPFLAAVLALAIDPNTPATLYAGISGGNVFKSTNGGESWIGASTGLTGGQVRVLAIDPATSSTLYAGTFEGVFKSVDAGETWSAMNNGLTSTSVAALAIDPSTPATLYAGALSSGGGLFKSTDGGENWNRAQTGLTNPFVGTLAIDPTTPATLYAGTLGPGGGVFKSTNGGGDWTRASTGMTGTLQSLAIDPAAPSTLYAGTSGSVFKTVNGGGNWSPLNSGLTNRDVRALAIDPTGKFLHAGTSAGVFHYTITASFSFHTVAPCRVADTRDPTGPYGGPPLAAGTARVFTIAGQCGLPLGAKAASVNVTVVGPTEQGHLSLYPGDIPLAPVSTINYRPGQTRANNAIVPLGAGGDLAVFCGQSAGTTHFIIDVNGYFE